MRTQVAIIGAGPGRPAAVPPARRRRHRVGGLETRSREYVEARIRAGILEHSTVELLDSVGLGERLHREGHEHRGIYLQWPRERHHLDFVDLVGRSVWVYGQTEVHQGPRPRPRRRRPADRLRGHRHRAARPRHRPALRSPSPTPTATPQRLDADVVVGCDGSFGPSRAAVPDAGPHDLGAHVSLLVAGHPRRRRAVDRRADLRLAPGRVRAALDALGHASAGSTCRCPTAPTSTTGPTSGSGTRWPPGSGTAQNGWQLTPGPITDKSVLPMRSFVMAPMRHGRLFLAGDAAHIVPPTGAKGLNLAVADVALLAPALVGAARPKNDPGSADAYSDDALRRVWRCTHFSWWMTTMLHRSGDDVRRAAAAVAAAVGHLQRGRGGRAGRELRRPADRLLGRPHRDVSRLDHVLRVR